MASMPLRSTPARWRFACTATLAAGCFWACSSALPPETGDTHGGPDTSLPCANPTNQGCPCATGGATQTCGSVVSKSDNYVSCSEGTRTCIGGMWGPCIGEYNTIKGLGPITQGDIHTLGLGQPSSDAGACSSNPCDPQCVNFTDTSNGLEAGPGGLVPNGDGGWTLGKTLDGGNGLACTGLQCDVPTCGTALDGGPVTTTITGTVYDPAAINPVFNAVVMIPNGPVQPIPAGVSSDPCGGANLPAAVTYTYSGTDGKFTLTNVPINAVVPVVIQIGRWRRQFTVNTTSLGCGKTMNVSVGCNGLGDAGTGNYAGTAGCLTRLPRTQSEGNIPHIAIATGGLDAIECMLYRMGVSSSEFTDENATGRINIFDNGGALLPSPAANHDASYLLGFTCGQSNCPTTENTTNIVNPSFESSIATGWTVSSGTVTQDSSQAHAGSDSALLAGQTCTKKMGVTTCVDVTSTLSQTFTAPAAATGFSFWVLPDCNGASSAVTDYFTAKLVDSTAGSTLVTWANLCDKSSIGWLNYTTSGVIAGHSYTFTASNTRADNNTSQTWIDDLSWTPPAPVQSLLNNYDLVMLPCDGGGEYNAKNWGGPGGTTANTSATQNDVGRTNLVNYAGIGGRVFTSHWGREWVERPSTTAGLTSGPFPGVATWVADQSPGSTSSATGIINTSAGAPWGTNFNAWMTNVGAAAGGNFTINPWREDTSAVSAASRLFVSYKGDNGTTAGYPADFTFDTPLSSGSADAGTDSGGDGGAGSGKVGRVMFTDMHLANGTPSGTFPGNCPTQGSALLQQEDAAEYLLFDLGACVTGLPIATGPTLAYYPATFTRDYEAFCPPNGATDTGLNGSRVVWRNFYWEDSTPGNSSIVFSATTADTQAQLGGSDAGPAEFPTATLATASGPDNCPSGPSCASQWVGVNVDPKLTSAGVPAYGTPAYSSHSWLRVTMTLNPTSDKMTPPTLLAWQQNYDCVPAE